MHPNYNDNTTDYDIAVIKLRTRRRGIEYCATCITAGAGEDLAPDRHRAYVTGLGQYDQHRRQLSEEPQQVQVPIVSAADCNDANSYDGDNHRAHDLRRLPTRAARIPATAIPAGR